MQQPDQSVPTDYIVVRLSPDLPQPAREALAKLDGCWFRRLEPFGFPLPPDPDRDRAGEWVAVATGRIELRDGDLQPAEVYEIRP